MVCDQLISQSLDNINVHVYATICHMEHLCPLAADHRTTRADSTVCLRTRLQQSRRDSLRTYRHTYIHMRAISLPSGGALRCFDVTDVKLIDTELLYSLIHLHEKLTSGPPCFLSHAERIVRNCTV